MEYTEVIKDGLRVRTYASGTVVKESASTVTVASAPRRRVTKKQFRDRLTSEEMVAIYSQDTNVLVKIWLAYFSDLTPDPDGTSVDLDDPKTKKGLEDLAVLIPQFTPERIAQILA